MKQGILDSQLNDSSRNAAHIKSRQSKAIAKLAKLKALGIISSKMSASARAYLFKPYIRPIILYGMEN